MEGHFYLRPFYPIFFFYVFQKTHAKLYHIFVV